MEILIKLQIKADNLPDVLRYLEHTQQQVNRYSSSKITEINILTEEQSISAEVREIIEKAKKAPSAKGAQNYIQ